jgi:Cu/Ag efflux pump CusA
MTVLGTALAMVPLAVGGDVFGHEIVRPLAAVILGGLVTSTLLNLFVLPSLYLRFATSEQPEPSTAQLRVAPAPSAAAD